MIKNIKRALSILIAVLLMATQIPSAFAESVEVNSISASRQSPSYYAFEQSAISTVGEIPASEKYITNQSQAVDFIRRQLKNREPSFILYYQLSESIEVSSEADKETVKQIVWGLFDAAMEETSAADEGDYLYHSYASAGFELVIKTYSEKTEFDITFTMEYFTSLAQERQLAAQIDRVIEGFGFTAQSTDYEKAKAIYDFITDNVSYDNENLEDESYLLKYSAYAALMHKKAVCVGYATLFYRMAKQVGLDVRVIAGFGGQIDGENELTENHTWNIVKIGGRYYYYVDSTWDADKDGCAYFLKGEKDFPNHIKASRYETAQFKSAYPIAETAFDCEYGTEWVSVSEKHHTHICINCGTPDRFYPHRPDNSHICVDCGAMVNPFTDVIENDYYYDAVLWSLKNQVTAGVSATVFAPNAYCSRAQVVSFLWRAAGKPDAANKNNPFTDVKTGQYYYEAVLWAVEQGITAGISKTSFAPDAACSRGQIVSFLHRFADSPVVVAANPFTDVTSGQYFYQPVLWAVQNGITAGMSKTSFAPNDTCSRGQVVSFLYRYMK